MSTIVVASQVRKPDHETIIPGPAAYTPEWVAACYGVNVNDQCPPVTIEVPEWAERLFSLRRRPVDTVTLP